MEQRLRRRQHVFGYSVVRSRTDGSATSARKSSGRETGFRPAASDGADQPKHWPRKAACPDDRGLRLRRRDLIARQRA